MLLHGFPDSAHIFSHILVSQRLEENGAKLVALDLPGFGGSDSLDEYGATEVLNLVVEAITLVKRQYLLPKAGQEEGQCILLGHDWGGAISYRIAAETTGLVDQIVILNSMHVSPSEEQLRHILQG